MSPVIADVEENALKDGIRSGPTSTTSYSEGVGLAGRRRDAAGSIVPARWDRPAAPTCGADLQRMLHPKIGLQILTSILLNVHGHQIERLRNHVVSRLREYHTGPGFPLRHRPDDAH